MLFQDASGMFASCGLGGTSIVGGGSIGNRGASWQLAKIVDVNQDGKAPGGQRRTLMVRRRAIVVCVQ